MLVRADDALQRGPRAEQAQTVWGRREWAWVVAAVVGFVLAIQAATAWYGFGGPVNGLVSDFLGDPSASEVKAAGLVLALVCMPRRWCLPFAGLVVAAELLSNVPRWLAGAPTQFGNGVMWALVALAGYAALRASGSDRVAGLKAAGIAGILIVANLASSGYLGLTMNALPDVADQFFEVADRALGSPSWVMGRFVEDNRGFGWVIAKVYTYLSVGAAVVAFWQLRHSATQGFPRHHIVRSFIVIGAIGPLMYFLLPVVGPNYAFGDAIRGAGWTNVWPSALPSTVEPVTAFFTQFAPRNCVPSLHTAWATAILLHALRGPRALQAFGIVWWVLTLSATLGFGFHYGVDLVAGFVFAVTVEAALVRPEHGWHRDRVITVLAGAAVFGGVLAAARYLSVPMAHSGPIAAIVLLGAAAAMVWSYGRIARAPSPQRSPPRGFTQLPDC